MSIKYVESRLLSVYLRPLALPLVAIHWRGQKGPPAWRGVVGVRRCVFRSGTGVALHRRCKPSVSRKRTGLPVRRVARL